MNPLIIVLIVLGALLVLFASMIFVVDLMQRSVYGRRGDGSVSIIYPLPSNYPNLEVKRDYFLTKNNVKLSTYEYSKKDAKKFDALVLLIHGVGAGHFYLFPLIEELCNNGFKVLCYDQFASGTSEGKKFDSMIKGAQDVKYALEYVNKKYSNLPLYVVGHSWGGYVASISLQFSTKIKKCIDISGFNCEPDMSKGMFKPEWFVTSLMKVRGFLKYGKVSTLTALDSFKKTDAEVLYLQGCNDATVNPKYAGLRFEKELKDKKNIHIKMIKGKGHTPFVDNNSQMQQNAIMSQFKMLGGVLVPFETYVDFIKYAIPDKEIYKMMIDFLKD